MTSTRTLAAVALAALLVGSTVGLAVGGLFDAPTASADAPRTGDNPTADGTDWPGTDDEDERDEPSIEQFDSAEAFATYLRESASSRSYVRGAVRTTGTDDVAVEEDAGDGGDGDAAPAESEDAGDAGGGPDRYSDTNVQEAALDEPDVLKSDGETIYYSDTRRSRHGSGTTHVLDASDPAAPEAIGDVPAGGELLLAGGALVAFEHDRLRGYDVSDPAEPEREWSTAIEGQLEAARLYDGDVYLVVADRADPSEPCPIEPLGPDGPEVDCTDVHYPSEQEGADTVYTTMRLDPATGEVEDSVSFLGSSRTTATYVSENAVYLTYADAPSYADVHLEFLLTEGREYLDNRTIDRLEQLSEYNLSERAKRAEIDAIMQEWRAGLDRDERRTIESDLEDAWQEYVEQRKRQFTRTGIVSVSIGGSLSVDDAGTVPGTPLNQWSMDEHDGTLRIATTIDAPGVESENDLYVLDSDLDRIGSVQGMGVDQRIFAVRYHGDTAYLVTFRQIDPFHVVDLSDPENPTEEGELELPGFSTYLHPLGDDRVLGIGEEDGKVKAVIFDASDPNNPVIEDDVILDDRWSAVRESHNAFLIDERHGVFFLPGSEGGHVFSYEDGLERVTTVETDGPALRAMYIDDYLYVFGDEELVVVDETTWEEVTYVNLRE